MARFRDSQLFEPPSKATSLVETRGNGADRLIGEILGDTVGLTAEQIERVLVRVRETGDRFGDAAVALGFVSHSDVMYALARQFHYPYASEERRHLTPELVAYNRPFSREAEVLRAIRGRVLSQLEGESGQPQALSLVSLNDGDGKSYLAANIAVSFAQLGGRTLLVDADLRHPRQHEIFNVENVAGLSSILAGRSESNVIHQLPDIQNLFLLPVGIVPPNPLELIERPAFNLFVREVTAKFDQVIIDTPSLAHGSDGLTVASRCGAALIVARKDTTAVGPLRRLVNSLSTSSAQAIGVILSEH